MLVSLAPRDCHAHAPPRAELIGEFLPPPPSEVGLRGWFNVWGRHRLPLASEAALLRGGRHPHAARREGERGCRALAGVGGLALCPSILCLLCGQQRRRSVEKKALRASPEMGNPQRAQLYRSHILARSGLKPRREAFQQRQKAVPRANVCDASEAGGHPRTPWLSGETGKAYGAAATTRRLSHSSFTFLLRLIFFSLAQADNTPFLLPAGFLTVCVRANAILGPTIYARRCADASSCWAATPKVRPGRSRV